MRSIIIACGVAGLVELSVLGFLRTRGMLSPDQYPWWLILGWPALLIVLIPGLLWLSSRRGARQYFQILGAIMVFGVFPLLALALFFKSF